MTANARAGWWAFYRIPRLVATTTLVSLFGNGSTGKCGDADRGIAGPEHQIGIVAAHVRSREEGRVRIVDATRLARVGNFILRCVLAGSRTFQGDFGSKYTCIHNGREYCEHQEQCSHVIVVLLKHRRLFD